MCCQKYANSMLPSMIGIILFFQIVDSWDYPKLVIGSKSHELFVHTLGATPIFLQTYGAYVVSEELE